MSRLAVEELHKRYRGRAVVSGVSLHVQPGEIVGLLGPNGAGKTTCFYMVVGLIPVDEGRVTLGHEDLTYRAMHLRARAGLAYLPQEASIFRRLSVADNVKAILETRPELSASERDEQCDELLHELGIRQLKEQMAISLSGGERRRLEIARALAVEPKFMLLDEPFAGVDPISVVDIQRIIRQLAERGIGILITDHNVRETLGACGRAYILNEGRLLAQGPPDQILADERVRAVYLGENFKL